MRPGDWTCPDCGGFVWGSRSKCKSNKCQRRPQVNGTVYEVDTPPSVSSDDVRQSAGEQTGLRRLSFSVSSDDDWQCDERADRSGVSNDTRFGRMGNAPGSTENKFHQRTRWYRHGGRVDDSSVTGDRKGALYSGRTDHRQALLARFTTPVSDQDPRLDRDKPHLPPCLFFKVGGGRWVFTSGVVVSRN